MFKKMLGILAGAMTWLVAGMSYADPIQDLSMQSYEAGWYPNYWQGQGPLTCARTCAIWVDAAAESEFTSDMIDEFQITSVCKITNNPEIIEGPINDPSSHWLYGNQFDDEPVCFSGTPSGVYKNYRYMCLCVCEKPDLIVSEIYDPVWDPITGQSLITVDITNQGTVASAATFASIFDPDTWATDFQALPAIAAGTTVTVVFTLGYWVFDPNATLEVTVDVKDEVDECDETNNVLVYTKQG